MPCTNPICGCNCCSCIICGNDFFENFSFIANHKFKEKWKSSELYALDDTVCNDCILNDKLFEYIHVYPKEDCTICNKNNLYDLPFKCECKEPFIVIRHLLGKSIHSFNPCECDNEECNKKQIDISCSKCDEYYYYCWHELKLKIV